MGRFRISPETYARVTLVALVALTVIVITGAAVRLTGSGLGCPDWPTCDENSVIAPLEKHALVEFVNRVFTGFVALSVIAGVLGSLVRTPRRRGLTWLSLSLVLGVIAQAVLGGVSVLVDLDPRFVMAHFLLSMVLLFAAFVLYHRAKSPDARPHAAVHRDYIWLGRVILGLTVVVLFVGTMVTGSGPHAGAEDVPRLGFSPHDITKVHGTFVWLLVGVTAFTVWRLHKAHASSTLVRKGEVLMVAQLVQGAIGYLQYSLGVPPAIVVVHIAGATAVWLAAIDFNLSMFERWEPIGLGVYDGDSYPSAVPFMKQDHE